MKPFIILLDGDLFPGPALETLIKGCRIIAADGAIRHARTLNIVPDWWVGDFDSSDPRDAEFFKDVPQEIHPSAKDQTDGEIAVSLALEKGAGPLIFLGAMGGARSDHAVQHLLHACALKDRGHDVLLTSGRETAWPLAAGQNRFSLEAGTVFSVLCLSPCQGLTVEGAKWPLSDVQVPLGSSWTISNVALGPVDLVLDEGRAILLAQCGPDGGRP